ncbi:hypothetical protein NDU88_001925 [Pleurodeles waltl]|uniref:Uncharacterized protein n=1 Tax=Pleurodeles waltl TaxID=8319 RepID=A0AAV7MN42_PLEWA|nr:hypothetical protein NDU88_001925 [Pleurodeles waltl]
MEFFLLLFVADRGRDVSPSSAPRRERKSEDTNDNQEEAPSDEGRNADFKEERDSDVVRNLEDIVDSLKGKYATEQEFWDLGRADEGLKENEDEDAEHWS